MLCPICAEKISGNECRRCGFGLSENDEILSLEVYDDTLQALREKSIVLEFEL